jgi:hypothetical protein
MNKEIIRNITNALKPITNNWDSYTLEDNMYFISGYTITAIGLVSTFEVQSDDLSDCFTNEFRFSVDEESKIISVHRITEGKGKFVRAAEHEEEEMKFNSISGAMKYVSDCIGAIGV